MTARCDKGITKASLYSSTLLNLTSPQCSGLPQGCSKFRHLTAAAHTDDGDAFFTPDSSPNMPLWEPSASGNEDTPSPSESASPLTPPPHMHDKRFTGDFEFLDYQPPSPPLADLTPSNSPPTGGRKRQFVNREAIMRAGADFWKGVTAIGSSPMPLTV